MKAGMDIADISSQMQVVVLDAGNRQSIADTEDGAAGGNRGRKAKAWRCYIKTVEIVSRQDLNWTDHRFHRVSATGISLKCRFAVMNISH